MSQRKAAAHTSTVAVVNTATVPHGTFMTTREGIDSPSTSGEEYDNQKVKLNANRKRATSDETSPILAEDAKRFWVFRAASKGDLTALARAITNTVGSVGFAIGSLFWVIDDPRIIPADSKAAPAVLMAGTLVFFGANVLFISTGISWIISARRAFRHKYSKQANQSWEGESEPVVQRGSVQDPAINCGESNMSPKLMDAFRILLYFEIFAALAQILGGLAFNVGCIMSLCGYPTERFGETNGCWLLGSMLFLLQGVMSQIMCASVVGPLLPLVARYHRIVKTMSPPLLEAKKGSVLTPPLRKCCTKSSFCIHRCIPACLLNTTGSFIFMISTILLFYANTTIYGAWGYLLGSIIFCFSNWADTLGFLDSLALRLVSERLAKHNLTIEQTR